MTQSRYVFFIIAFLIMGACGGEQALRPTKTDPKIDPEKQESEDPNQQPEPKAVPIECTSVIALGARAQKSGECSGPYELSNVTFYKDGRALAIDLSNLKMLGGAKIQKHTTVLFDPAGMADIYLESAQKEYQKWFAERTNTGPVTFYITFWAGKKSDLIVGELKELVEHIRRFFPDKVPKERTPIHVELEP